MCRLAVFRLSAGVVWPRATSGTPPRSNTWSDRSPSATRLPAPQGRAHHPPVSLEPTTASAENSSPVALAGMPARDLPSGPAGLARAWPEEHPLVEAHGLAQNVPLVRASLPVKSA